LKQLRRLDLSGQLIKKDVLEDISKLIASNSKAEATKEVKEEHMKFV
jgi:hypothetical protein